MLDHEFTTTTMITKVDNTKRLVYGIVLEPDTVDAQFDLVPMQVVEDAAHDFLAKFNKASQLGVMHTLFGELGISLVQSYIAPVDFELNGVQVKVGTWVMVVKVFDDALWERIQNGEITGFSIGGVATVPA